MISLSEKEWERLDNSIIDLTSSESLPDMDQRLLGQASLVFPAILHAGIFEVHPGNEVSLIQMTGASIEAHWLDLWKQRFSHQIPLLYDRNRPVQMIDWTEESMDAYATDFMLPQGIGCTLYLAISSMADSSQRVLVINRARGCSFDSIDLQTAMLLSRHLPGLYRIMGKLGQNEQACLWQLTTAIKGKALSHREAEVVYYMCRHLTVPEISTRLHLSPRTIETYVNRSYGKLGVFDRKGLYRKLLPELQFKPPGDPPRTAIAWRK